MPAAYPPVKSFIFFRYKVEKTIFRPATRPPSTLLAYTF